MTALIQRIHHVTYVVSDTDQIETYFRKYFGLEPMGVAEPPGWGFRSLLYKVGDAMLDFSQPFVDEKGEAIVQRSPATKFAKILREQGPGLFHVALAVNGIDDIFEDLKKRGLNFTQGEHATTVHTSVVGGYRVLNIHPKEVGPTYANANSGCFFQVAEGGIVPMPGWI